MNETNNKIIPGGLLIAFEGIDGSGKTTIAQQVTQRLASEGYSAVYLSEPTDGLHGRKLREIMVSPEKRDPNKEFELFLLDRQEDVSTNINPVLQAGGVVCIDRYYISSMAYQGALGIDPELIRTKNEEFAPAPDLILRFIVSVDTAHQRINASRSAGTNSFEKRDYLERVNAIFDTMSFPQMVNIPAEQSLEKVFNHAWAAVFAKLTTT